MTEERHYRPGASDPEVIVLRQGGGLGRTVRADTALAAVVGTSDGELTPAQIAAGVAALTGTKRDAVLDVSLLDLRGLILDRLLTLPARSSPFPQNLALLCWNGDHDSGMATMTEERSAPSRGSRAHSRMPRFWGAAVPLVGAAVSAIMVLGLWAIFVMTATGQRLDDTAALGAVFGRETLEPLLKPVLTVVSIPFVAAALIAAVIFAVLQRRQSIAVGAAVLLSGANLTTQLFKDVLVRPDLGVTYPLDNSLPSGHTTVAASVAATALLIAPHRIRGVVAVVGAGYAALTGLATLVGGWHRPADVVAAYLVVATWYFLVEASRQFRSPVPLPRGYRKASLFNAATFLTGLGLLTGLAAVGIGAWVLVSLDSTGGIPHDGGGATTLAYAGGSLAVAAAACLTMCSMLVMRPFQRD